MNTEKDLSIHTKILQIIKKSLFDALTERSEELGAEFFQRRIALWMIALKISEPKDRDSGEEAEFKRQLHTKIRNFIPEYMFRLYELEHNKEWSFQPLIDFEKAALRDLLSLRHHDEELELSAEEAEAILTSFQTGPKQFLVNSHLNRDKPALVLPSVKHVFLALSTLVRECLLQTRVVREKMNIARALKGYFEQLLEEHFYDAEPAEKGALQALIKDFDDLITPEHGGALMH